MNSIPLPPNVQRHLCLPILCGLSALLFLAGTVRADSQLVTNLKAGKAQTLVTYGTSLTAGGAWVNQVESALQKEWPGLVKVINSGQGAMWSKWGVEHLEERVITKKPDTVLIEFAINDAYLEYKTTVAMARDNLNQMIDRILAAKPETEVILMTMNPPTAEHLTRRPEYEAYYRMYHSVAWLRNLRLIDHHRTWNFLLTTEPATFKEYVPDGIHPSAQGCQRVITPEILSHLGLVSAESRNGSILDKTLSPDQRYGITVPLREARNGLTSSSNILMETATRKPLVAINGALGETFGRNTCAAEWFNNGHHLLWTVEGKWFPASIQLLEIRENKCQRQIDLKATVTQAILQHTQAKAPKVYEIKRKENASHGLAYPDGFTVYFDLGELKFPLKVHATLTNDPKSSGLPERKETTNPYNLESELNGQFDAAGKFSVTSFKLLNEGGADPTRAP